MQRICSFYECLTKKEDEKYILRYRGYEKVVLLQDTNQALPVCVCPFLFAEKGLLFETVLAKAARWVVSGLVTSIDGKFISGWRRNYLKVLMG